MEAFHWIVVPISTVLGLSVARILTGYVNAFKARATTAFYWLPFVLAGAILGVGLQFWWAMFELSAQSNWSLPAFTLLLAMIMTLFTAAALVTPAEGDRDMRVAFRRDGHWALVALAVFHLLAIVANTALWKAPLASGMQAMQLGLAVLCILCAGLRAPRWQEATALLYVAVSVADTFSASVASY